MLVASLPQLPRRFDAGRLPIAWPPLRERLRILHPDDGRVTRQLGTYFLWDRQPLDRTDEDVIARYHDLLHRAGNPLVRHLVHTRTQIRLLLSAIRRRANGQGPPDWAGRVAGMDTLGVHLRKYWNEPQFRMAARHPWLEPFIKCFEAKEMIEAQRVVFDTRWNDWTRIAERYTFSFEAIIAYLVRWEIVDRWTSQNTEAGQHRFINLIEETLGEYANAV